MKELEAFIPVSTARPQRTDQGWVFDRHGAFRDALLGSAALHEVYTRGAPGYTGRATVPVLFDAKQGMIVSNESADIVRMLGSAFAAFAPDTADTYPRELRPDIDAWNERIHRDLNNGVYRAGFATTQAAYDEAVVSVFETLRAIDARLAHSDCLCGNQPTEADWRLLPTLVRFDVGYYSAFKCNLRRISEYPHIFAYLQRLLARSDVRETVHLDVYRRGYHSRSDSRNRHGIVPLGPLAVF